MMEISFSTALHIWDALLFACQWSVPRLFGDLAEPLNSGVPSSVTMALSMVEGDGTCGNVTLKHAEAGSACGPEELLTWGAADFSLKPGPNQVAKYSVCEHRGRVELRCLSQTPWK